MGRIKQIKIAYEEGKSVEEIANSLGIKYSVVRKILSKVNE
jgi:transposase|tara:strand:+ start:1012 stop:1134 length:123 start_codon:yes stop_codon:yes gene_type:complete